MTVRTGHDSSAFVGDLRCPPRANIRSGIARPCVRRPSCCACDPRAPIPWRSMSGDNYIKKRPELQREFLNNVLDNVPVMVLVKDAVERRFMHTNRAAETFWGFSRAQAIGKTMRELFPTGQTELIDRLDAES